MKAKMNYLVSVAIIGCSLILLSFVVPQDASQKPWDIPSEYKTMVNPVSDDATLMKVGKMLYSKHCKSCHGNMGEGDGPKAESLDTFPGDFTLAAFHAQSDGELYYKSIMGRDEMPNYEDKITEENDRWAVIMYMRTTFKK